MTDMDARFHREWLGLAQPIEGLVFAVQVLADAQIAPRVRVELTESLREHIEEHPAGPALRNVREFFTGFLGYDRPEMLIAREALPKEISFYAVEGRQEIRPSFAISREPSGAQESSGPNGAPSREDIFALVWDLSDDAGSDRAPHLSLDKPETETGSWSYPPTAKLERLLRESEIPIGLLTNRRELRLVFAPKGESSGHLTFRFAELLEPAGRPILAALELLLGAERTYGAALEYTLEGLLHESRRRQANVTEALAEQVFEAVEILLEGFERAAERDSSGDRPDWLREALAHDEEYVYQGVLSVILRLVFLLYAEDQGLLPVDHPLYAQHLSVLGLYESLREDEGVHPESMHHRFGAYGRLLALFRAIYLGVSHGDLKLPPRRGKLFDPNAFPFLEGGFPGETMPVNLAERRAEMRPPSVDDGTLFRVLDRLIVFEGQRLSYRALDVKQIGSIYESLMGYRVMRAEGPAVRLGKARVWVELEPLLEMKSADLKRELRERVLLTPPQIRRFEEALKTARQEAPGDVEALAEALEPLYSGKRAESHRHRAEAVRLGLKPGDERRRTGSHYTPRALTQKVVSRTLEPIIACLGKAPTPEQILSLKICDPAMGSGASLVEVCRQLADELTRAWRRTGEFSAIAERHEDAELHARRLVAQRCLYGVDKNASAVELAKLSLWLITLNRELPFTFVDHALRHGDSLVGLGFEEIRAFDWAAGQNMSKGAGKGRKGAPEQLSFVERVLGEALDAALDYRGEILELADRDDDEAQEEKRRLLTFAEEDSERVRVLADACVGAFFAEAKPKDRERERERRLRLAERWILEEDESAGDELRALAEVIRREHAPFHWMLEFPEVFYMERPDPLDGGEVNGAAMMDAFVGNPPFLGGRRVSELQGVTYNDWIAEIYSGSKAADLSAHFFRRAAALIGKHGAFGLVATNTIAQGDTRNTGLKALVDEGWSIFDGVNSMPWPGAAAVTVSIVHAAIGAPKAKARPILDELEVEVINSMLRPKPERPEPVVLRANAGSAYLGSKIYGQGFLLTPEEREELIAKDAKNGERIFPYIGGEEVNTSPTQDFHRYVINFGQMSLEEAERWPDLIEIVRARVKPERDRNNREVRRKYWWRFGEVAPALYEAIAPLERCLVNSQVSKHVIFAFQPTDRVFSHALNVFPLAA